MFRRNQYPLRCVILDTLSHNKPVQSNTPLTRIFLAGLESEVPPPASGGRKTRKQLKQYKCHCVKENISSKVYQINGRVKQHLDHSISLHPPPNPTPTRLRGDQPASAINVAEVFDLFCLPSVFFVTWLISARDQREFNAPALVIARARDA